MASKFIYNISTRRMTLAAAQRWAEIRGLRLANAREIGDLYFKDKLPVVGRGYWTEASRPEAGGYIFFPCYGRLWHPVPREVSHVVAVSI